MFYDKSARKPAVKACFENLIDYKHDTVLPEYWCIYYNEGRSNRIQIIEDTYVFKNYGNCSGLQWL